MLTFALSLLLNTGLLTAQSPGKQSESLLRKSQATSDISQKISLLQKAVEMEPQSFEPHWDLGRAYLQIEEFTLARKHLLRAYAAQLRSMNNEVKSQVLYDLATAYHHLGEFAACEDALRGARNLTTSEAQRSKIAFELGEVLFKRNQFADALQELSQCSEVTQEQSAYYDKLLAATTRAVEVDKLFLEAQEAELNGQSAKAKTLYVKINNMLPGFKNVEERLDALNQEEPAVLSVPVSPEKTRVQIPTLEKDGQKQPRSTDSAAENRVVPRETPESKIESNGASNDDLTKLQNATKPEGSESEKQTPVNPSASEMWSGDISRNEASNSQTITTARKPDEHIPENKPTVALSPSRPRLMLKRLSATTEISPLSAERNGAPSSKVFLKREAYRRALRPDIFVSDSEPEKSGRFRMASAVGFFASTFAIFGVFILTLSPTARAHCYVLIGKKHSAIPIFERLLKRQPEKLWLYPALAKLYYFENRTDESAMRVYRMIQHLNMHDKVNDALTANIVNKYLSDDTVPVQIEIMEQKD